MLHLSPGIGVAVHVLWTLRVVFRSRTRGPHHRRLQLWVYDDSRKLTLGVMHGRCLWLTGGAEVAVGCPGQRGPELCLQCLAVQVVEVYGRGVGLLLGGGSLGRVAARPPPAQSDYDGEPEGGEAAEDDQNEGKEEARPAAALLACSTSTTVCSSTIVYASAAQYPSDPMRCYISNADNYRSSRALQVGPGCLVSTLQTPQPLQLVHLCGGYTITQGMYCTS